MSNITLESKACRICNGTSLDFFVAREMMYGLRENFSYFECASCKCVQISEYPADMARHYPSNYYAYAPQPEAAQQGTIGRLKAVARSLAMGSGVIRNAWLQMPSNRSWIAKQANLKFYVERFRDPSARMLDVGCGAGELLRNLRLVGFKNAEGIDPYIESDVVHQGRTLVWKRHLSEVAPSYQCISFHHSLEHMPGQAEVIAEARRLLAPGGVIIIRIPIVGKEAWRVYRENWVQLDPPRHFYLHSEASLRLLAQQCGLVVDEIVYDSYGLQIWGSELYLKDIPLLDERSPARGSHAIFSSEELAGFDRHAADLNAASDGDQVMAILRAPS